ncbi:hypothetical protein ABZ297_31100 [Nonomuraea sp. NPDC005983]|uniref:hypothetical protein n=1 Tax=Nonomuraea sp. NPDC005983 TaxID=3155595 RepID=UPI00339ED742
MSTKPGQLQEGRQQAIAVGQDAVGPVEQLQLVVFFPGEGDQGSVGAEFTGGQVDSTGIRFAG